MPLYEYQCDACGHRFEKIQKSSASPVEPCPKCGSEVRKLMSSPAIQFKGSGFYITDYAKKDSGAAGKTGGSKDKDKDSASSAADKPAAPAGDSASTSSTPPAAPAPKPAKD